MMRRRPSRTVERFVGILLPPACREQVLGDLHERFESPAQYAADVLATVPLVILSRIRRTADSQVALIHAFVLYLSFIGAAWLTNRGVLVDQLGLFRLAIPAAIILLGVVLDDAYADPCRQSSLQIVRGPVLGLLVAVACQALFWAGNSELLVPMWVMLYGSAMSLLLSSAVRMLFPPITRELLRASVSSGPPEDQREPGERSFVGLAGVIVLLAVLVFVYEASKR